MGFPKVLMTQKRREVAATLCVILYNLGIFPALIVVVVGVYIKVAVQDRITFLAAYEGGAFPFSMVAMGVFSVMVHIVGIKLSNDFKTVATRTKIYHFLFPFTIVYSLVYFFVFVSGVFSFYELTKISTEIEEGLQYVMRSYQTDGQLKQEMDIVQTDFSCCGVEGYMDWFEIEWIHHDYRLNEHLPKSVQTKKALLTDSVPFSCCNPMSLRPCVHNHVLDNTRHYAYDYRLHTTLHAFGCKQQLMTYFGSALVKYVGLANMILSFFQLTTLIFTRLLQTSVDSLHDNGKLDSDDNLGWLLGADDHIDLQKKAESYEALDEWPPEGGDSEWGPYEGDDNWGPLDESSPMSNVSKNTKLSKSAPEPLAKSIPPSTNVKPPTRSSVVPPPATPAPPAPAGPPASPPPLVDTTPDKADDIPQNLDSLAKKSIKEKSLPLPPSPEPKNVSFQGLRNSAEQSKSDALSAVYNPYANMVFPKPQENTSANSNTPQFIRMKGGQ